MNKIMYYINPEKRVVTCIITHTKQDFNDFVESVFDRTCCEYLGVYYGTFNMPNRFVGMAVCSPEDVWDEKIGRDLAYARARKKRDKAFFNVANKFMNCMDKKLDYLMQRLNQYGDKIAAATEAREEKIKKMIQNT